MSRQLFVDLHHCLHLSDLRSVLNLKAVVAPCLERMINLNLGQKNSTDTVLTWSASQNRQNGIVTLLKYPWVVYNPVSMQYIIVTVHIVKLPQVLSPLPCASHIYVSCITAQHIYTRNRGFFTNRMWVSNIPSSQELDIIQRAGQPTSPWVSNP